MSIYNDGTGAVMVVRAIPSARRRAVNMPTLSVMPEDRFDHVLVVSGEERGAGRNGYVNVLASAITMVGRRAAIIEIGSMSGSATLAHKAAGLPTKRINPGSIDWYVALIDLIDEYADRVVIISIPADRWLDFAGRVEAEVIKSYTGIRPICYLFVDPTGSGRRLSRHIEWLSANGFPAFHHRLVLRGKELTDRSPVPTPAYHSWTVAPFLMEQVALVMFGRDNTDQPRRYGTFERAFETATSGTRSVMIDPIRSAIHDIAALLSLSTPAFGSVR